MDGVRVLKPETMALMTSNQLTPRQRAETRMLGQAPFARGHGFGLGNHEPPWIAEGSTDVLAANMVISIGGVGTVGWPGAYGGWWQADPNDGSVLVLLSHNMVELSQLARGIGLATWSAIATFHARA